MDHLTSILAGTLGGQRRPIHLGDWELAGQLLRPSHKHLQTYASKLATAEQDELLSFDLQDGRQGTPKEPRSIHVSRLIMASPPLRALATGPFLEAQTRRVPFQESAEDFRIIRRFVYCQPIDMSKVPLDFAFVADRWELSSLFRACFEMAPQVFQRDKDQSIQTFVNICFPFLTSLQVPKKFCKYFALRLALSLENMGDDLKRQLFPWLFSEEEERQSGAKKRKIEHVLARGEAKGGANGSLENGGAQVERGASSDFAEPQKNDGKCVVKAEANPFAKGNEDESKEVVDPANAKLWMWLVSNDMLSTVVHYAERYTNQKHCEDLMELVMHRLESFLSEGILEDVLEQFEWETEACGEALESKKSEKWPLRSWRSLAKLSNKRMRPYAEESHIVWVCEDAGLFLRSGETTKTWEGSCRFGNHEVSLGLLCFGIGSAGERGLYLSIRLDECGMCNSSDCEDWYSGGTGQCCEIEIWPRVNVVENGCGCGVNAYRQFQGRIAEDRGFDESKTCELVPGSSDLRIKIMSSDMMKSWQSMHRGSCGLVLGIRLWSAFV